MLSKEQSKQKVLEALPNIRRYAYSLTGNWADADDLLQALVERLLKTSIPSKVNSVAWMLKVCRNIWIDECRKKQVGAKYLNELLESNVPSESLEEEVESQIKIEGIQHALSALTVQQREVMSLVVISGLSYSETAEVMNVPIGTVMSRLARARIALSQVIDNQSGGE